MYFYNKKRAREFVRNNPFPTKDTTLENLIDWHMCQHEDGKDCGECGKPAGLMSFEGYTYWNDNIKDHNPLCYSCHRRLYPETEFTPNDFEKYHCFELQPIRPLNVVRRADKIN